MTHDYADKSRGIRLQKALAEAGVASRRECEEMIQAGRVRVNGAVVDTLPAWVDPATDRFQVDGEPVTRPRSATSRFKTAGRHYVMLHKPRRVVSTVTDEPGMGRTTVVDLVDLPGQPRLYPVGRLDTDSTGLILLTDDGELTQRLTHPRYGISKRYLVSVKGKLEQKDLDRLRKGLFLIDPQKSHSPPKDASRGLPGKRARMEKVEILRHETDRTRGDRTTLAVTLGEGQNREIRRMFARLGFRVRRLQRTSIGPLRLKGLSSGQWRKLTSGEVASLRRSAGLR